MFNYLGMEYMKSRLKMRSIPPSCNSEMHYIGEAQCFHFPSGWQPLDKEGTCTSTIVQLTPGSVTLYDGSIVIDTRMLH